VVDTTLELVGTVLIRMGEIMVTVGATENVPGIQVHKLAACHVIRI